MEIKRSLLPYTTVFAGSFLLFLIQPVVGRTLLPVFGGASSVWLLCLAAWQSLLLAGYYYAHFFRNRLHRINWHIAMLLISAFGLILFVHLRAPLFDFIQREVVGTAGVLVSILLFAALPYALLAAGASLTQTLLTGESGGKDLYHLYAVSNAGSFCGLFCYPFLVEPFVPIKWQWYCFSALLALYALLLKLLGNNNKQGSLVSISENVADASSRVVSAWKWFVLPALSCFLLNAVIASMFVDVTPLPMIWVFYLGCFLLSYVVGFSKLGAFCPRLWFCLALISIASAISARRVVGTGSLLVNGISAACVIFFFGSWLHHRLFLTRPKATRLTSYYLIMTAGGAVGGLLASVVAPLLFNSVFEYPLALWLSACMLFALPLREIRFFNCHNYVYRIAIVLWALMTAFFIHRNSRQTGSEIIYAERNFYGTLRITRTREVINGDQSVPVNYLWSGQTTHGLQIGRGVLRQRANSYYGVTGGGIAVLGHPRYQRGEPLTVGVVGLGTGSMASYGRPNDLYRFFEINPAVIKVACNPDFFSYLTDSRAAIDLIEGDARRMLEVERDASDPLYDVLMIDAYSGDAVPNHLATKEAFDLYFERLKEDGILALHVSNWHIDLLPLCKAAALHCGAVPYGVVGVKENAHTTPSIWVFMTRTPQDWRYPLKDQVHEIDWPLVRTFKLPSDDCGSLISLIRWR